MKNLLYDVTIQAQPVEVWAGMLHPDTYAKWVKAFSENSQFIGEWKQGTYVQFIDPTMGGTKAIVEVFDPPHRNNLQGSEHVFERTPASFEIYLKFLHH